MAEDLQGVAFPPIFNHQINKTGQLLASFLCTNLLFMPCFNAKSLGFPFVQ